MDYNTFLMQSMAAGARMDEQGDLIHTPASIATFNMLNMPNQHLSHNYHDPQTWPNDLYLDPLDLFK